MSRFQNAQRRRGVPPVRRASVGTRSIFCLAPEGESDADLEDLPTLDEMQSFFCGVLGRSLTMGVAPPPPADPDASIVLLSYINVDGEIGGVLGMNLVAASVFAGAVRRRRPSAIRRALELERLDDDQVLAVRYLGRRMVHLVSRRYGPRMAFHEVWQTADGLCPAGVEFYQEADFRTGFLFGLNSMGMGRLGLAINLSD